LGKEGTGDGRYFTKFGSCHQPAVATGNFLLKRGMDKIDYEKGVVEAGSNTSTVTLRVVGGDEKGSLKSETVKYGHESQRTRTRERLPGEGQQHIQKTDPSSSQRGRPTQTRP
jgi:hypothetical protein